MSSTGFHNPLTELEAAILSCFSTYGELYFPTIPNVSECEVRKALDCMRRKQVIKDVAPYRLTKLGMKLRNSN